MGKKHKTNFLSRAEIEMESAEEVIPSRSRSRLADMYWDTDGSGSSRRHSHRHCWDPVSTPCGHLFHKGCIMEWLRSRRNYEGYSRLRGTCPTCRKSVATYNLVRVYLTPVSEDDDPEVATPVTPPEPEPEPETPVFTMGNGEEPSLSENEQADRLSYRGQLYSELFNIRRTRQEFLRLRMHLIRTRMNMRLEAEGQASPSPMEIDCANPDCVELRNAFYIVTRECKSLQRRLAVEQELSKMKSILVASQQRDINELKMKGRRVPRSSWIITLGVGGILGIWLIIAICLIFSVVANFDGSEDVGAGSGALSSLTY